MHTTHVAFRGSVVCGVCTHSVYSPSGQLDRVGGLVRAQAERRCAAVVPGEDALDVVVDIVWSGEHERPLTLCERMCLEARARMSSIFFLVKTKKRLKPNLAASKLVNNFIEH